jgi:small subunit ribosomal protein S8e
MRLGRKPSGGKYHKRSKKKHHKKVGQPRIVKMGETKKKKIKLTGGSYRVVLLNSDVVNLFNPKTKKTSITKIKNVLETPSNKFFARQNIIQRSTVIETELGKARITNRPSQEGNVQAVLIE